METFPRQTLLTAAELMDVAIRRMVCLNDLKKLKEQKAIGKYARYKGKL